jgi:Uma2 family endonuclease
MSISTPRPKSIPPAEPPDRNGSVPPLRNGDRLTRDEFMRRYEAMPELNKAELIEGVVCVPSPVSQRRHGRPHSSLVGWLFHYEARTPGVELGDNSTVHLDHNNTPQPDGVLFIQPESGGHVRIDEEGYIVGAPDLVAEVSASSVSYDLTEKLKVYERNGIREYIVWRVVDRQVNWLVLREAGNESLAPSEDGILRSTFFPGLWLDPSALLEKNFGRLLNVLDHGLDSPNHAEFVARLQQFEQRAN